MVLTHDQPPHRQAFPQQNPRFSWDALVNTLYPVAGSIYRDTPASQAAWWASSMSRMAWAAAGSCAAAVDMLRFLRRKWAPLLMMYRSLLRSIHVRFHGAEMETLTLDLLTAVSCGCTCCRYPACGLEGGLVVSERYTLKPKRAPIASVIRQTSRSREDRRRNLW